MNFDLLGDIFDSFDVVVIFDIDLHTLDLRLGFDLAIAVVPRFSLEVPLWREFSVWLGLEVEFVEKLILRMEVYRATTRIGASVLNFL